MWNSEYKGMNIFWFLFNSTWNYQTDNIFETD